MDIFDEYATNEEAEINGTWFPYGDAELLIARAGNRIYNRKMASLIERHRVDLEASGSREADLRADKANDEVIIELMADTILLGWRGNFLYKKQPLEYSPENARLVLKHRGFRSKVAEFAEDATAYKLKQEEEQGNA